MFMQWGIFPVEQILPLILGVSFPWKTVRPHSAKNATVLQCVDVNSIFKLACPIPACCKTKMHFTAPKPPSSIRLPPFIANMISDVAHVIAMISMMQAFMTTNGTFDESRIRHVEAMTHGLRTILEHIGTAPSVGAFKVLWSVGTHALTLFETSQFPEDRVQTRQHLAMPPAARPLCAIADDSWLVNRQHIEPAWAALQAWIAFLHANYNQDLHLEAFRITEDARLLMITAGHLCGITLASPRANPPVEEY